MLFVRIDNMYNICMDIMHIEEATKLLGVSALASRQEISKAFRIASKDCHPDMFPNDPTKEERFKLLSSAYETLTSIMWLDVGGDDDDSDSTLDEDLNFIKKHGVVR